MKKFLMKSVRFYQKYISPGLPARCRYYPTCSQYTLEALQKHGAYKGTLMGLARIFRCHPFVHGGVDLVPDHFSLRRNPDKKWAVDYDHEVAQTEKIKKHK